MGQIHQPLPVLLFFAVFSSVETAFDWTKQRSEKTFGKLALRSQPFPFEQFTDYYTRTMGEHLPKELWAFEKLIDPADLPTIKILTNTWEEEFKKFLAETEPEKPVQERPLNIDPGYIELGKLVLASTKNHAHRIYLSGGIFAETTLIYTQRQWKALPWSYPDYQSPGSQNFLTQCRNLLKEKLAAKACPAAPKSGICSAAQYPPME
ncbi:GTP-binding protein [Planctomycetales bacterium]|nr:GTP-binding protein [Planctomycetales bacterium]